MENISIKIRGTIAGVASEVNDLGKEYSNEKITAAEKAEQIKNVVNIAEFRVMTAVKSKLNEVLGALKAERVNTATYERIKDIINESL